MAAQHAVQPEVGRHDIEQPGDRGRLEVLAARRMDSGWPARRYVRSHGRDHNTRSNDISTLIHLPYQLAGDHPVRLFTAVTPSSGVPGELSSASAAPRACGPGDGAMTAPPRCLSRTAGRQLAEGRATR